MVTSINGERIDSAEKLDLLVQKFADTPTVRLGIERNGQPLELKIRLD